MHNVGKLSGGEKAKAALARLCATGANLLVMDEPTNHLDIWSCDALERSIVEFEGTVLVVTHDRYFLNEVADRLIVIADGKARIIEGDYESYQRLVQTETEAAQARSIPTASTVDSKPSDTPKGDRRKRKFPYKKPQEVEAEIALTEQKVKELEDLLGQPNTWKDALKARSCQQSLEALRPQLERLYEHWEEAAELNA